MSLNITDTCRTSYLRLIAMRKQKEQIVFSFRLTIILMTTFLNRKSLHFQFHIVISQLIDYAKAFQWAYLKLNRFSLLLFSCSVIQIFKCSCFGYYKKYKQYNTSLFVSISFIYFSKISPTGSHLDSLVANISYQNPPGPLISQYDGYEFMCGDRYTPSRCTKPCTCTHVYHISLGALVDILIYDKEPLTNMNHPFHLHGYSFCVLYTGQFINARNKNEITDEDVAKEINAHMNRLQSGYYKNCAPKDSIIVPNTGFVIMRLKANNPVSRFHYVILQQILLKCHCGTNR
ncbi:hypothetical protein PUN28_003667 [Cardiocondyla obscurior]|uniref:Plastocyanin-like domain-containing protein n=1 Tax=Cardiocondyla obscurior TaxID=286306 RepID=A0AAW2GLP7_9HYME